MSMPTHLSESAHRRLVLWCLTPPIVFFIGSQWLTNFTAVLNGFVAGAISWAMLLAILQFVVAIVVGFLYVRVLDRTEDTKEEGETP